MSFFLVSQGQYLTFGGAKLYKMSVTFLANFSSWPIPRVHNPPPPPPQFANPAMGFVTAELHIPWRTHTPYLHFVHDSYRVVCSPALGSTLLWSVCEPNLLNHVTWSEVAAQHGGLCRHLYTLGDYVFLHILSKTAGNLRKNTENIQLMGAQNSAMFLLSSLRFSESVNFAQVRVHISPFCVQTKIDSLTNDCTYCSDQGVVKYRHFIGILGAVRGYRLFLQNEKF